jgi:hypothetical protein
MGFGFNIDVASSDTSTLFEIISATDAALTAGIVVHNSVSLLAADRRSASIVLPADSAGRAD